MKQPILRTVERLGLLAPAYRAFEALKTLRALRADRYDDGLAVPPARLRVMVAGTADAHWFLESGRRTAATIRSALARTGFELESGTRMLDFGCGCGRVARHWRDLDGVDVHGSDYNAQLVAWCARNLDFATFSTNRLPPPLQYEDRFFDVVYAMSVLTHLPESLQLAWLAEFSRVLREGGRLLVSTHGDRYRQRLTPEERAAYDRGELVVRWQSAAGMNLCTAFHPEKYVRETLARGFELLEFAPEGAAAGNPYQDLVVLRKPER